MIDVDKYFKPLPKEADYDFQEHLTDHLLGDILTTNEEQLRLLEENRKLKIQINNLNDELQELSNVRKQLPDIQQPYVLLYRQMKKQLTILESKLLQIEEYSKTLNEIIKQDILNIIK